MRKGAWCLGPAPSPALLLHLDDVGGARRRALSGDGDSRGCAWREVWQSVSARRGTFLALRAPPAAQLVQAAVGSHATFDPHLAAEVVGVAVAVVRALGAQVLRAGVVPQRVGGVCGQAVGGVTQVVHGVLEGQRLQAALLAERRVQRPPHLRRALRLTVSGRHFDLVWRRLGGERVGEGVVQRGRGVSDGSL